MKQLRTQAPGKLILSGEHAVVYGNPAIAIAIDRFAATTLSWHEHHSIKFHLLNLSYTASITMQRLRDLKQRVQNKYQLFLDGECTIYEVLQRSVELLQYAFIHMIDKLGITLPQGLAINTSSNIPIGCGMGSSAASIVSVMHAINSFLELDMQLDSYLQLGRDTENLQHGHSSGLDLYMSLNGGCAHFKDGGISIRDIPNIPMYLIDTGKPKTTTGQCVADAAKYLDNILLEDFAAVTDAFDQALQTNKVQAIQECIRANHKLLTYIGVVPKTTQEFITAVEQQGAAAKICGAGASAGEKAGAVLVVTEDDISPIVKKYGYKMRPIHGEKSGTKII